MKLENQKLLNLQILRGIAAMFVVIDHTLLAANKEVYNNNIIDSFSWFLGDLGVSIFFVISGFIMYYTNSSAFGEVSNAILFIKKRIIRIVPLYWFLTFINMLLLIKNDVVITKSMLIGSYLFIALPNELNDSLKPIISQGWTLNYEMFFYYIFAFAITLNKKIGVILFVALMALLLLSGIIIGNDINDGFRDIYKFYTNPILILFVFGVLVALAQDKLRNLDFAINGNLAWSLCLVIFITLIILCASFGFEPNLFEKLFVYLSSTIIVFIIVNSKNITQKYILAGGVLIGEASYALYLSHSFTNTMVSKFINIGLANGIPFIIAQIITSLFVSVIIYKMIEKPMSKFLNSHLKRVV